MQRSRSVAFRQLCPMLYGFIRLHRLVHACLLFITSFLLHWWTLGVIPDFLRSFINVLSAEGLVSTPCSSHIFWLVNQHLYGRWRHFCWIYWFVCCCFQSSHILIQPWAAALWQCVIHPDCFPAPPGIKTITLWNRAAAVTGTSWVCRSVVFVRRMSALWLLYVVIKSI